MLYGKDIWKLLLKGMGVDGGRILSLTSEFTQFILFFLIDSHRWQSILPLCPPSFPSLTFPSLSAVLRPCPAIILLQEMRKYIISIEEGEFYPFDPLPNFDTVLVRYCPSTPTPQLFESAYLKLHRIVGLQSPLLMRVLCVRERKGRSLSLDYEHVGQGVLQSQRAGDNGFIQQLKEKLHEFGQFLAMNAIQTDIKIENIGVDKQGRVKIYIGLDFELLQQNQKKRLEEDYHAMAERLIETHFGFRSSVKAHSDTQKSDYSHRLDQKLMEMEGKLSRLKLKSRNSSQDSSSSSCHTMPVQKNSAGLSKSSKLLNSSLNTPGTSQSVIANPVLKTKVHKSSFGDCETVIYRENEEMKRDESLKKRVTNALQKTQEAFKVYEKYSKRKRRI